MIQRKEWQVTSSDGEHSLWGVSFEPEKEVRGIVQIVHGMTDYTLRYEELLLSLAEDGYVSFGFDLLGHGKSARDLKELGFFAEKNGWRYLVDDVGITSGFIREQYGAHLPYFLLGHSMGSFIARIAATECVSPAKLILVGSAGADHAAPMGIFLANSVSRIYGKRHVSFFLQGLVFGDYDRRFPGDYPNRWITVDTKNLIRYKDDPFCTFRFTVSAVEDLIRLHQRANSKAFFSKVSKDMPILFLSGKDDPVGDYGKGIEKVCKRLTKKGCLVSCKLYEGFRHEILQDFCKEEVTEEIKGFLKQK